MESDFPLSEAERKQLERLNVAALVLFGSRAQGLGKAESDYDIGVLLREPADLTQPERRREIYDALYDLLSSRVHTLTNIDIVFLEAAPAELQAHVVRYGKVMFESDPDAFANFKERAMLAYADFAPIRDTFHRSILERIP